MAKYYDLNIPGSEVQRRLDLASHNVLAFDGILDVPVTASDELITAAESYQILYAPNGGRGEMLMSIGGTYYRNFRLQSSGKTYLDSSWYNEDGQIRRDRLFLNGAARDIYAYAAGSFGKVERDGVDGQDGSDGITPHIDPTTKHWMLGDEDTGIVAEGKDGEDGTDGTDGQDGKSAFDIWLENGHSGNISDFLAWMKDTSSMIGPKFAATTADCVMVNDTPTLYFVPNGTTFNVYLADSNGQGVSAHSLATGVPGDITNYAGIYDISQDKAVNGVPATYGNLSEALGAITEDSKKKGGMTIKFIQGTGSAAKYVQYRYLLSSIDAADFTNEANWEGVTDTIDASGNIVTAKAVWNKFHAKVAINIGDIDEVNAWPRHASDYGNHNDPRNKGVVWWDTEPTGGINRRYGKFIRVNAGEVYVIKNLSATYSSQIVLATNNTYTTNRYIDFATGYNEDITLKFGGSIEITVPDDCTYIYILTRTSTSTITSIDIPIAVYLVTEDITEEVSNRDRSVTANSDRLITSGAVYEAMSDVANDTETVDLSGIEEITGYYLGGSGNFGSNPERGFKIIGINEGDQISILANNNYATYYACFASFTYNGNETPSAVLTTERQTLLKGEKVYFTAPAGSKYLYVFTRNTELAEGNEIEPANVSILKPVKDVLRDVGEKVAQDTEDIVLESTITFVAKPGTVTKTFYAKENHLYKITFDKLWDISDFGSTQQLSSDVILNIITRNPLVYYADVRRKSWGFLDTTYYLYGIDKQVEIIARGTEGETVDVKVTDVTNIVHNKELFDITFFDTQENNVMESMLVKLEKGQVARYRINATSGFTYMKAYNRAVRNDDYKITELVADESGYMEGDYFAVNDTYIVIYSVKSTGFTPKFRVYEEGKASNDGIKYPYQLVFDTENIRPIISLTDEGNHYYDNTLINFGQIISKTDIVNGIEVKRLYLLYQGYGTAVVGTDGEPVSNILMAYSEDDGDTWIRGIPDGISKPYPDADVARINGTTTYNNNTGETTTTGGTTVSTINNVIFKRGRIVGEVKESSEVINEFAIAKVSDSEYPYRMVASVRNGTKVDGTISGQKNYMFKSNNLVKWEVVGKVTEHAHDSICSIISYGDKLLVFIRMWKFKEQNSIQNVDGVRMIGSMWLDIAGNVIQPPSGLFGDFLYNPAATQIGVERFLFLPTRLIPTTSIMEGDNVNEAYIMDKGKVRWCPCYNIDRLNQQPNDNFGWNYVAGIVAIGTKQYVLYGQRQSAHSESTVTEGNSELRLCPVEWITYDKYNVAGG